MRNCVQTLFALVLATSAGLSTVPAASVSTAPLGFVRHAIHQGRQSLGLPLHDRDLFVATVAANSAGAVTVDTGEADLRSVLGGVSSCYVEITADDRGLFTGDRLDVDVPATLAAADGSLVLREAAHNTLPLPLRVNALAGCTLALRRHLTLAGVFGAGSATPFSGSSNFARADRVLMFNAATGGFTTYYLHRSGSDGSQQWWQVGAAGSRNETVVPPGAGLMVLRASASPVDLVATGTVRTNDFILHLGSGYSFVGPGFPGDRAPVELSFTAANGFVGGGPDEADRILKPNGTDFDVFYLHSGAGAPDQWRASGGTADLSRVRFIPGDSSVLIRRAASASSVIVPGLPVR